MENVRVACRDYNLLAATRAFGDAVVDRYARRKDPTRGAERFDPTTGSGFA